MIQNKVIVVLAVVAITLGLMGYGSDDLRLNPDEYGGDEFGEFGSSETFDEGDYDLGDAFDDDGAGADAGAHCGPPPAGYEDNIESLANEYFADNDPSDPVVSFSPEFDDGTASDEGMPAEELTCDEDKQGTDSASREVTFGVSDLTSPTAKANKVSAAIEDILEELADGAAAGMAQASCSGTAPNCGVADVKKVYGLQVTPVRPTGASCTGTKGPKTGTVTASGSTEQQTESSLNSQAQSEISNWLNGDGKFGNACGSGCEELPKSKITVDVDESGGSYSGTASYEVTNQCVEGCTTSWFKQKYEFTVHVQYVPECTQP